MLGGMLIGGILVGVVVLVVMVILPIAGQLSSPSSTMMNWNNTSLKAQQVRDNDFGGYLVFLMLFPVIIIGGLIYRATRKPAEESNLGSYDSYY